jgi:uncharacterized protein YjbI with pentapeptide repeats
MIRQLLEGELAKRTDAKAVEAPATRAGTRSFDGVIRNRASGDELLRLPLSSLRGAALEGHDLTLADLSKYDLSGCNLTRCNLYYADLSYANLGGALLKDANMKSANLRNAILTDAIPGGVDMLLADLRGADMRVKIVQREDGPWIDAFLRHTFHDSATKWPPGYDVEGWTMTSPG